MIYNFNNPSEMKNQNLQTLTVIFLLFTGILLSSSSKAQSEFGVKGGILFSNIGKSGTSSSLEIEGKNGLSIGAYYKKENLLGRIGFQTELLYQQKGAEYFIRRTEEEYISDGENQFLLPKCYYRDTEKLHYLSVPILFTIPITKFMELYAGPEFGYLVSMKNNRIEETGELNRFSAGVAAGFSLNLGGNTNLDFRYSYDLTPFDFSDSQKYTKYKNYGFAVTIQQTLFKYQK